MQCRLISLPGSGLYRSRNGGYSQSDHRRSVFRDVKNNKQEGKIILWVLKRRRAKHQTSGVLGITNTHWRLYVGSEVAISKSL